MDARRIQMCPEETNELLVYYNHLASKGSW